jgi:hypothetical protein
MLLKSNISCLKVSAIVSRQLPKKTPAMKKARKPPQFAGF